MRIGSGEHLVIVGTPGAGKTQFIIRGLLPIFPRVIVVDTTGDDFTFLPRVSVRRALALARSNYSFRVRVELSGYADEDEIQVDTLCRGLLNPKAVRVAVVFDEVTDYTSASYMPPAMSSLIRKARHHGHTIISATQRLQYINKGFFANSVHRVYFYLSDYDCARVRDYAPWLQDRVAEIPYKSFRSLYQAPDGSVILLGPVPKPGGRN